jgi:hypothetical protein
MLMKGLNPRISTAEFYWPDLGMNPDFFKGTVVEDAVAKLTVNY